MSLQKAAPIQLAFSGGLDTKSSSPSVQPTQLVEAENVQFTNPGELSKRLGSVEIGLNTPAGGPSAGFSGSLGTFNNSELVLAGRDSEGDAGVWSYDQRNDQWTNKGTARSLDITTTGIWNDASGQISPDAATADGLTLFAWSQLTPNVSGTAQTLSSVNFSIVDESTQAVIVSNQIIPSSASGAGHQPTCVAVGTNLFVWYAFINGGTERINWTFCNVNSPGSMTSGTFSPSNFVGTLPFGARPINATTQLVYWCSQTGGNTFINGQYFDNLGNPQSPSPFTWNLGAVTLTALDVVPAPASSFGVASIFVLAAYVSSGTNFLAQAQTYAQHGLTLIANRTLTGSSEPTKIMNITGVQNGPQSSIAGDFDIYWELAPPAGSANYDAVVRNVRTDVTLSSQSGPGDLFRSVGLASKAFADPITGQSLVWLAYDDTEQATYFLTNYTRSVIGKACQNSSYGLTSNNTFEVPTLPKANLLQNGTSVVFGFPVRVQFTTQPGGKIAFTTGIKRVEVDFADERFRMDQLGQSLQIGGGVISSYDGATVCESGYHVFPPAPTGGGTTIGVGISQNGISGKTPQGTILTFPPDQTITATSAVIPCGAQIRPGQYVIIWDADATSGSGTIPNFPVASYLWFEVDGIGSDPNLDTPSAPAGSEIFDILCKISSTDPLQTVISKVVNQINDQLGPSFAFQPCIPYTAVDGQPYTGVQISSLGGHSGGTFVGNGITPVMADTQLGYAVMQIGTTTVPEITRLVFPAGKYISGGEYFFLESSYRQTSGTINKNTIVEFYFVRTDMTEEPTQPSYVPALTNAFFNQVPINILSTYTEQQVAAAFLAVVNAPIATGASLGTSVILWGTITGVGTNQNVLWGPCVETVCSQSTTGSNFGPILTTSVGLTRNGTVGGGITPGNRQYVTTYEWVSAKGELSSSRPSDPFTAQTLTTSLATANTGSTVQNPQTQGSSETLTCPTYRLTGRTNCQIGLFRTIAEEAGGAEVFYRVATLANNSETDFTTYQDSTSDTDLLLGAPLYTSSGEVANIAPPPAQAVVQHLNRIFLAALDDENTIWYSKPWSLGYAVGFSPDFTIALDQAGGPVTALGSQDSYLVIFKQSRILVIEGNGPDVTGANGSFSPPTIVNSDVGAINQDSVVFTPSGTLFQSLKGIYLLDRSLNVTYVGAPVEGFNDLTITSAVLMPTVSQVRFGTDEGTTLMYDYIQGQWSSFTYGSGHATDWNSTYVRVADSGAVYKEQPGTYTDAGTPIAIKVVTAWYKPGNALQGFARVWRVLLLGKYLSGHNVQVGIAINYDPTIVQYATFDAMAVLGSNTYGTSNPYGVGSPYGDTSGTPVEQFRIHLGHLAQKAQSYQFTITELPSGAPGAGLVLQGIGIEAGVKGTTMRLPSTRQGQ